MKNAVSHFWAGVNRNHGRRMFALGIIVGALVVGVFHAGGTTNAQAGTRTLEARVAILEHACVPINTGGGVTQCNNPTTRELAYMACLRNNAYIGATQEDTRHLFVQCVDDYMRMRGWR